ncbi:MAG: hypothetical protein OK452_07495, partial [Thaumarchaeota archaeon]|nr:hypothetical protein [Nitrososphaerota archaeon]
KTGGNPFFIEELVRSLVEQGVLFRTATGWDRKPISEIEIPTGVRTVIKQRLSNLDEESLTVLSVASVTSSESKEFSFALLKAVTGMEDERLVDVMDRILKTRLIRETKMAGGRPGFTFTDTRIRDAIYDEMTVLRRSRYHLKAAQGIEEIYKNRLKDVYGVLVYHYLKGNDPAKCFDYAVKAADRASGVYAHGEAINYLKIALEALEESPDVATRSKVLEKLGEASRYAGRQDFAKHLEEAARLAVKSNEKERAAVIYRKLAFWVFDINRENVSAPTQYFEKAKALLADVGETAEVAQFDHTLARFYFIIGKLSESQELATKALALAERLNLPEVEAHSLLTLAILAPATEWEGKFRNMQRALRIGLEHNFYDVIIRAYNNLTVDSQNVEDTLKYANDALSFFEKIGYKPYIDYAKLLLAGASGSNGDIERGKLILQEFLSDPSASQNRREAVAQMGEFLSYQGRFKESEEYLLRYQAILEGSQDFQQFLRVYSDLEVLYLESGDLGKAKENLNEFMKHVQERDLSKTFTYASFIAGTLWYGEMALVRLGEMEAAKHTLREAKKLSETAPIDQVVGLVSAVEGALLLAEKKFPEAEAAYGRAVELVRKANTVFFTARMLLEYGKACMENGHPEKAKKAFDESVEIFARMKGDPYIERVRAAAIPLN